MQSDFYLKRCFEIAARGSRRCSPNPMVGAVLVYENRIIAEGFHAVFGGDHAEVACIKNVKDGDTHLIKDATLYVSLEPCNHFGKTPPCSHLIINQGIKNVVVGSRDPNPLVNGSGIDYLIANGVDVSVRDFQDRQRQLNKRFYTHQLKKRPYIILKWAESADGFLSTKGEQTKISNGLTDVLVHKWRSEEDCIWAGANTVLTDNPKLTVRHFVGPNPLRILYDKNNSLLKGDFFFTADKNFISFHSDAKQQDDNYVTTNQWLEEILSKLYSKQVGSILVEGGTKLLQTFIDRNLFDEIRVITNSKLKLHEGHKAPIRPSHLQRVDELNIYNDQINLYLNSNS